MKRRHLIAALAAALITIPALAVFNEKDLGQTLSVLRFELGQEVGKGSAKQGRIDKKNKTQHVSLIRIMKQCNELSLMLYSQNQDCTFDMTYALKEVTRQYEEFNERKLPFDDITTRLDLEIERYSRLVEALRRIPPQIKEIEELPDSLEYHNDSLNVDLPVIERRFLRDSLNANGHRYAFFLDEKGQEDRDTCLHYASVLVKRYSAMKDRIVADNEHYEDASAHLKESYDYAQERYRVLQKRMLTQNQDNWFKVLGSLRSYSRRAFEDAALKYGRLQERGLDMSSEWRGPVVFGFLGMVLVYLAVSVLVAFGVFSVLKRKLTVFREGALRYRTRSLALLAGIVIFALTISIARLFVDHNFFVVASGLLLILSWLLIAIMVSIVIRLDGPEISSTMRLYMPVILMGILVVVCRIIFIPNRMMNLFLPPVLLGILLWQLAMYRRHMSSSRKVDAVISRLSLFVISVSTVMAWAGYVLLSILLMIWWLFQIAAVESVVTIDVLLGLYRDGKLKRKLDAHKKTLTVSGPKAEKGEFVRITWLYDFFQTVVIPVAAILSVPFSLVLALDVFDLDEIFRTIFYTTFFDFSNAEGAQVFKMSLYMIVLASSLFFVFRYINYIVRSLYRDAKLSKLSRISGKSHIHTNEVNLTLANNVISILVWGSYVIITVVLLKIPTGAVSIIAAGLATGIGLAMKDILNNFIYGIQLMSGRLRVGDWVECDGVRGKVTAISYQSTQIETIDGAVMSFLNTSLFNKNFKNLTRNNAYEFVKITVGVAYGSDVEKVREVLMEALAQAQGKDGFGRDIVDLNRGTSIVFDEFGDSSVDVAVKQYVLVPEKAGYVARAKEMIYNALNANGIEIPFPQRDIHIVTAHD